jgi:hypothetical protein
MLNITGKPTSADRSSHDLDPTEKGQSIVDNEFSPVMQPSMFRSVCLIAACSTAMVVNVCIRTFRIPRHANIWNTQIANVSSLSIALPSVGKNLGIPEQRLQWLVSAYSLSSVRSTVSGTSPYHELHLPGMLFSFLRSPCRLIWTQESFYSGVSMPRDFFSWSRVCKWYHVRFFRYEMWAHPWQMKLQSMFSVVFKA